MAHTPGPWEVGQYPWMIVTETDDEVAQVHAGNADYKANARLIAAAPALVAACEAALLLESSIDQEAWYASSQCPDTFHQLRAALTLAKGECRDNEP